MSRVSEYHYIGCSEWARAHEERFGRENLDASTLVNLDEMKRRGRASCCSYVDAAYVDDDARRVERRQTRVFDCGDVW